MLIIRTTYLQRIIYLSGKHKYYDPLLRNITNVLCLLFDLIKLFILQAHVHRTDACLHACMKPHLLSALPHETTTPYRFHSPRTPRSQKRFLISSEYPTTWANSSLTDGRKYGHM